MKTTQFQQHNFAFKTQSRTKDSSGICYYNQEVAPSLPNNAGSLEEYGPDYFNSYLHLNDDLFFEDCPKVDSTLPDFSELGLIPMENPNPMSQDRDPFLSTFPSAINMLNSMDENESYRDLSSLMPSFEHPSQPTLLQLTDSHLRTSNYSHSQGQQVPASPALPSNSDHLHNRVYNFGGSESHQDYIVPSIPSPSSHFDASSSASQYDDSPPPAKMAKGEIVVESGTKYVVMRKKNNIASRRSRLTKKEKEKQLEDRATELEQHNERLKVQISQLELMTQRLKSKLMNAVRKV